MIEKKNNLKSDINKYNIFLAILRMYLSFLVVNAHLFNSSTSFIKNIYILKLINNNIHVPNFFIMSFYFCYKTISSKNYEKIKNRIERLIIPYFIWPIIILFLNNLFYLTLNLQLKRSLSDLLIQFITGHNILDVLWFQLNLIISTILILSLEILFKKNIIFILFNLTILAYTFQYSNLNYNYFNKFNYYIRYPYGRFMEIIPFCISGCILSVYNITKYLNKYKLKTIYILFLVLLFFIKFNLINNVNGFIYQGINLHIKSLIIFLLFLLLPSEKITNINIIKIVKIITNFTSGIYYLHKPVYFYISNYIKLIKQQDILGCLIIYLICYFISFIGIKIFGKTKLRNLFV